MLIYAEMLSWGSRLVVVVGLVCFCAFGLAQEARRFEANVHIEERNKDSNLVIRDYDSRIFYADELEESSSREALKLETLLAATGVLVHDLRVFEDQFLRYTWCDNGTCGWQDIFPNVLPQMWCPAVGGVPGAACVLLLTNLLLFMF